MSTKILGVALQSSRTVPCRGSRIQTKAQSGHRHVPRTQRAIARVLIGLAAAVTTMTSCDVDASATSVPVQLVGSWNGGAGSSSRWWLTISNDGRYRLYSEELRVEDQGFVSSTGTTSQFRGGVPEAAVMAGIQGCNWTAYAYSGIQFLDFCNSRAVFVGA